MARTHARVHLDIWSDDDWRSLSHDGQWLYVALLTSPTLSFCGVADWRPARLAALASDMTAEAVCICAEELIAERFILPDPSTEEVLVRSFVKWDGLMATPNIAKAMARDHGATASGVLRAVAVDELTRLKRKTPDLGGWKSVGDLLKRSRMTFDEGVAQLCGEPFGEGSGERSDQPCDQRSRIRRLLLSPFSILPTPSLSGMHEVVTMSTREGADA